MFAEASFTALAEELEPAVIGRLLNEYLTEIVFERAATLVKILGDALNACASSARWRAQGVSVENHAGWDLCRFSGPTLLVS